MNNELFLLTVILLLTGATAGCAGPSGDEGRVWRDPKGRVIRRLDREGHRIQYGYDEAGNLVQVEGFARGEDPCGHGIHLHEGPVWVHQFEYEGSHLVAETDCIGRRNMVPAEAKLDPVTGTTLKGHVHMGDPEFRISALQGFWRTVFEYGEAGRIYSTRREEVLPGRSAWK